MTRRLFLRWSVSLAGLTLGLALPQELWAAGKVVRVPVQNLPPRKPQPPRLLMIDAGHGGHDPGAIGKGGIYEKNVVLDVARRLAEQLAAERRVQTKLTRDRDEFLPLAERVRLTREARADLFVSIHADSAPTKAARGLSIYSLSKDASDEFARDLATRENMADAAGGLDFSQTDEDVAEILFDLAQRHTINASLRAKAMVVKGVGKEWPVLTNPLRSANFAVLRAPDVPSILIETGFLSNDKDAALLSKPKMREKIARLLARELKDVLEVGLNG